MSTPTPSAPGSAAKAPGSTPAAPALGGAAGSGPTTVVFGAASSWPSDDEDEEVTLSALGSAESTGAIASMRASLAKGAAGAKGTVEKYAKLAAASVLSFFAGGSFIGVGVLAFLAGLWLRKKLDDRAFVKLYQEGVRPWSKEDGPLPQGAIPANDRAIYFMGNGFLEEANAAGVSFFKRGPLQHGNPPALAGFGDLGGVSGGAVAASVLALVVGTAVGAFITFRLGAEVFKKAWLPASQKLTAQGIFPWSKEEGPTPAGAVPAEITVARVVGDEFVATANKHGIFFFQSPPSPPSGKGTVPASPVSPPALGWWPGFGPSDEAKASFDKLSADWDTYIAQGVAAKAPLVPDFSAWTAFKVAWNTASIDSTDIAAKLNAEIARSNRVKAELASYAAKKNVMVQDVDTQKNIDPTHGSDAVKAAETVEKVVEKIPILKDITNPKGPTLPNFPSSAKLVAAGIAAGVAAVAVVTLIAKLGDASTADRYVDELLKLREHRRLGAMNGPQDFVVTPEEDAAVRHALGLASDSPMPLGRGGGGGGGHGGGGHGGGGHGGGWGGRGGWGRRGGYYPGGGWNGWGYLSDQCLCCGWPGCVWPAGLMALGACGRCGSPWFGLGADAISEFGIGDAHAVGCYVGALLDHREETWASREDTARELGGDDAVHELGEEAHDHAFNPETCPPLTHCMVSPAEHALVLERLGASGWALLADGSCQPRDGLGSAASEPKSRGLLLKAVQSKGQNDIQWVDIPLGDMTITVAADNLKAPPSSGAPPIRLPAGWNETIAIAQALTTQIGEPVITASKKIADAIYAAAPVKTVFHGLVKTADDQLHMDSVATSQRFNDDIDAQIAAKGGLGTGPQAGAEKFWVFHARLDPKVNADFLAQTKLPAPTEPRVMNYGAWNDAGSVQQSVGGVHNALHSDYSQIFRPVKRYAKKADGSQVDLLAWMEQNENVPRFATDLFRFAAGPSSSATASTTPGSQWRTT